MAIVVKLKDIPQVDAAAAEVKLNEGDSIIEPLMSDYSNDLLVHLLKNSVEENKGCHKLIKFVNDNPNAFSAAFPRDNFILAMAISSRNENLETIVVDIFNALHVNNRLIEHVKKQALLIAYQQLKQNVSMGIPGNKQILDELIPIFAKMKHSPTVFEVNTGGKTVVHDVEGGTALYVSGLIALRVAIDQSVDSVEVAPKTILNLPEDCKTVTVYNDSSTIVGEFEVRVKPAQ